MMNQIMQQVLWKIVALILLLAPGSAMAAVMTGLNYNMQNQVIASGGGTSSSLNFTLRSSAGEAAAGVVASSVSFALKDGFLSVPHTLPAISLTLNRTAFNSTINNVMALTATVVQGAPLINADVYIARQLPGGTLLVMQPNGSFSTAIAPLLSNVPIRNYNGVISNYTFTVADPAGAYSWFAALTTPGTLNVIGTLAVAPFTFTP